MDFNQFKKEWAESMVYNPSKFDYDNTMHDLYVQYKESIICYSMTVEEWCNFRHEDNDLDMHPYMLKSKALKTHHSNDLRKSANQFRKIAGLDLLELIIKKQKL